LSFENIVKNDIKRVELNKTEYKQTSKERVHISKSKIDAYSNALYLKVGKSERIHYNVESSKKYIAATNMTYDVIITIFDVNTQNAFAYRFFKYDSLLKVNATAFITSLAKSKPNLEGRIIGMQNNQDFYFVINEIIEFFISHNIKIVEIDLFGTNTRHIALDTKLGQSYNVLLEDRLYRPGELANSMTIENFESELKKEELDVPVLPVAKQLDEIEKKIQEAKAPESKPKKK
jgi:hypothetical protein